jgi:hypothetical protein
MNTQVETETYKEAVDSTVIPGHKCQVYFVFGELIIEPKVLCIASARNLGLFIRNTRISKPG